MSFTRPQLLQPVPSVQPKGLVVVDAVDSAWPLDTVDVLDTFVDQAIAFAMQPTVVFLGNARHPHHGPFLRAATQIRH